MMQVQKWLFAILVLSLPVAALAGWVIGTQDGFDTGYKVAYVEMDNLLRQGARDGRRFMIEGVNVRFVPREPHSLEIAGAGADVMLSEARE